MSATFRQVVGLRLRRARMEAQLSQAELAKICKCQSAAISHWETGRRMPSLENLALLRRVLELDANQLLSVGQAGYTNRMRVKNEGA